MRIFKKKFSIVKYISLNWLEITTLAENRWFQFTCVRMLSDNKTAWVSYNPINQKQFLRQSYSSRFLSNVKQIWIRAPKNFKSNGKGESCLQSGKQLQMGGKIAEHAQEKKINTGKGNLFISLINLRQWAFRLITPAIDYWPSSIAYLFLLGPFQFGYKRCI